MKKIQQKSNIEKIRTVILKDNFINKPIKKVIRKLGFYTKIYNFLDKFELHDEISMKFIKKLIKKNNPLVLEIGAHIGQDTKRFIREFEKIKIFSFEPDPRARREFINNVKSDNSKLIPIAISDKNGYIILHQSSGRVSYVGGKEKIDEWTASSTIRNPINQSEFIKYMKEIKVRTYRLDDWVKINNIRLIDFIWADVEGAERELIKGGQETLNKKTRFFYTEFFNSPIYEGQPSLEEIKNMLPNFKVIGIFGSNVLMKNIHLN